MAGLGSVGAVASGVGGARGSATAPATAPERTLGGVGPGSTGAGPWLGGFVDLKLSQELVAAKVAAESSARRAQMAEAERSRVQRTLEEAQASACGCAGELDGLTFFCPEP
jgi:hypothetical protein